MTCFRRSAALAAKINDRHETDRHVRWSAGWPTLLALLATLLLALAACGNATPSGMPSDSAGPDATPIAASGWKTYSNTAHHYAIDYPANWFLDDTTATADYQEIYNFDPNELQNAEDMPPPPYNKYSI